MDPHRLGEERSIALHARIAELIDADPEVLARARERVEAWSQDGHVAGTYVEGWRELLGLPLPELRRALVDPGERAKALRQVSPFAGALDARERWRIRREVSERETGTTR